MTSTTSKTPAALRRAGILDEAVTLFSTRGYDRTTMNDIAAAVGVQKPSLYHYYDAKEAILAAIHDRLMTELVGGLPSPVPGESEDELLGRLVAHLVDLVHRRRGDVEVSVRERRLLDAGSWSLARGERRRYAAIIRTAIEEGQRQRRIRADVDPEVATQAIVGACTWMFQWYDPDGPWTPDQVSAVLRTLLLDGLAPPRRRAPTVGQQPG